MSWNGTNFQSGPLNTSPNVRMLHLDQSRSMARESNTPLICQKVNFQPQNGIYVGGLVQKVHFLSPKGPLSGGPAPNQSWQRV